MHGVGLLDVAIVLFPLTLISFALRLPATLVIAMCSCVTMVWAVLREVAPD